jgi:AAA family ATP:ADP antiporter
VLPGESVTALLLSLNGFLILAAYYVIRPLRAAFLLPVRITLPSGDVLTGAVITSYVGAILAGLFLVIVPLYGKLASRVSRIWLINALTLFFISNLIGFYFLGRAGATPVLLGIGFTLWTGIFNLMVVAQFWSFANDLYTVEQGKRLFAIVGFGYTVGAIAGALITSRLIVGLGELPMMLISAAILLVCLALTNLIHARERNRTRDPKGGQIADQPLGRAGGFQLVLGQRYLLLIGLLTLAAQVANTGGNYIRDETLGQIARQAVAAGTAGGLSERQLVGSFMAGMDFWQNVLVVAIQFFLVSRVFKYLGVGGALLVLPTIAFGGYGLFAVVPALAIIRVAQISVNATDYSLQNTVRRALFLPTSREAKYKALQAIETFFWRTGDMLSAATTFVIVQLLGLGVRSYAVVNLAFVAVWILIAVGLSRENRRLTAETEAPAA